MNILARLGNEAARHLYLVEVTGGYIEVLGYNRTQAASIATKAGYVVRSMSMEG
jgi:hypothetical protein